MHQISKKPVSELAGLSFDCVCGRTHGVPIKQIIIGPGTYTDILKPLAAFKGKKVLLVADIHTYEVLGSAVKELLEADYTVRQVVFRDEHLRPDEKAVGRLCLELGDADIIVTVGSGTLNDITRFVSVKMKTPYIIAGTAPSMDGYASVTSALVIDGVKVSVELDYPEAVIGDTSVMKGAPMYMLHAGLGDILGKYTALSDWRMSSRLTGEYYCREVASLVENAIDKCVGAADGLARREEEPVRSVMEGLLLSGIAIGMVGISRPAAGDEHSLAHSWEMLYLSEGRTDKWLHGNMVGVATGVMLEVIRYAAGLDLDAVLSSEKYLNFDREHWEQAMHDGYGRNAETLIREKLPHLNLTADSRRAMAENIAAHWDYLRSECFGKVPPPEEVKKLMKELNAVYHPAEIGLDRDTFRRTFLVAKDVRVRYGVLQLVEDLGLMETVADYICDLYYK